MQESNAPQRDKPPLAAGRAKGGARLANDNSGPTHFFLTERKQRLSCPAAAFLRETGSSADAPLRVVAENATPITILSVSLCVHLLRRAWHRSCCFWTISPTLRLHPPTPGRFLAVLQCRARKGHSAHAPGKIFPSKPSSVGSSSQPARGILAKLRRHY